MKSLYLRIYATVVVVLLLFAIVSGWIVERHLDQERVRTEQVVNERLGAWAELLEHSLPGADAPAEVQAAVLRDWSQRLRVPLALDGVSGQRIGASESFQRRSDEGIVRPFAFKLNDGRTLWTMRPGLRQPGAGPRNAAQGGGAGGPNDDRIMRGPWPLLPPGRRAASAWRSCWSCSSSPLPPARIPSCGDSPVGSRR